MDKLGLQVDVLQAGLARAGREAGRVWTVAPVHGISVREIAISLLRGTAPSPLYGLAGAGSLVSPRGRFIATPEGAKVLDR